jgi:DNA-binding NarL/FixJ family response regulator
MGKVLLADSGEYAHKFAEALNRNLPGWEVTHTEYGIDAIEAAKQGDTDVIVINTWNVIAKKMPDIECHGIEEILPNHRAGIEALINVKKIRPDQRVIILTEGPEGEEIKEFCMTFGAESVETGLHVPRKIAKLILQAQTI